MGEPEILDHPPKTTRSPNRRKRILFIAGILLLACLVVSGLSYVWLEDHSLHRAREEADQLDPGWQLEELIARRATIPDEQNSALAIRAARAALPASWPMWDAAPQNNKLSIQEAEAIQKLVSRQDLCVLWDERSLKILRDEVARAEPALAEVRKVLNLPRGRHPLTFSPDIISTLMPHLDDVRQCVNLLAEEARLRALDGDAEGALTSSRCIVNAGRSLGDEPTLLALLIRLAIRQVALKRIEQTLALGQPQAAALAALQSLLEEEEREPLFLVGMRGERACSDRTIQSIKPSQIPRLLAGFVTQPSTYERLEFVVIAGSIKSQRAALLHWNNRVVEIAKLPLEEQNRGLVELEASAKTLPKLARLLAPAAVKIGDAWIRSQMSMRCAIALLAAERYRQAHGHWPKTLADLMPEYLQQVPVDAYDGAPLRFRPFSEGVLVYSIGPDRVDNGGNLDDNPQKQGTDWGFRFWDVARRRQPPRPPKEN